MVSIDRLKLQERSDRLRSVFAAALLSRCARCGICITFSILLAAAYLTTQNTSVLSRLGRSSWPTSQSFWDNLSRDPRGINNCSYSTCPRRGDQNKTHLVDPFDPKFTSACPFYFRWIHEDLAPWKDKGISKNMLDSARPLASFRIVIKNGRLFVDPYQSCFQTRAIFTIWGFLQLLRYYPGLVPDVDLVFGCGDRPGVLKRDYGGRLPPPVFRYCSTIVNFDIPFPDWSFWGWPEVNLRPWDGELCGIVKGGTDVLWEKRARSAFWKGNPDTGGALRQELLRCNNRGAQIVRQNWYEETKAGFKSSRLAEQCKNRYKIYVEGWGWSVSSKYILACNSPVLLVKPVYYDFFLRGMEAKRDYWPVRPNKLCNSIKFAVDWGNNHTAEAEAIGRAGQHFITKEVSMERVYDYMLQLLREYAKLLHFEPAVGNMTELCTESFMCMAPPREKPLYEESMVQAPSDSRPCFLPPRDEELIRNFTNKQQNMTKEVEEAEELEWTKS